MNALSLQELVQAYCDEPTPALRNAIIGKSLPLVRSIVGKINRPDTPLSQYEDLESAGVMGLLQALDNYSLDKDVQFQTFAYYRIKGNIIDYLRKIDEIPRNQRTLFGKAMEVMDRLTQELGREPQDAEMATAMNISLDEYQYVLSSVQQRSVLSLNEDRYDESGDKLSDYIADEDSESPDAQMMRDSMSKKLKEQISKLKERDRLVLALYYYEDLTLAEIALLLGLTEARISQIVGKLLLQLRGSIKMSVGD